MPSATIQADQLWNDTGVDLVAGRTYQMFATGQWRDWTIVADANGFTRWYLKPFKPRIREERFFRLIGCVGKDESRWFAIGTEPAPIVAPTSGRLWCFANDVRWAYGNNHGEVTLTVT
jgi:hypothetical protein